MKSRSLTSIVAMAALILATALSAQEVEPGVQTSTAATPVKPTPAPAVAPAAENKPKATPASSATTPPRPAASTQANSAPGNIKSSDRIDLGTTQISGNRELPKVMYVVPWRRADPGDFAGRPPNSLLDEALTPVDRDVFRRQNSYYGAVHDQAQAATPPSGAPGAPENATSPKDEK
jgi:hypothetical protein